MIYSSEGNWCRDIEAEGHDAQSLLFAFLDELLFIFHTEFLVCKKITVTNLDRTSWSLRASGCRPSFLPESQLCSVCEMCS